MMFKRYPDEEHETENETEERILRNRGLLRENIEAFKERYWDIYEEFGFSFEQAYISYVNDMRTDDGSEDWR